MSSPPLPDNALLLWLQDESNNECATSEAITQMYSIFDDDENEPIEHFQQDDRHHCFLIFEAADEDATPTATILHHLARVPTRIGNPTPFDGSWYLSSNLQIGGQQITVELPDELFTVADPVQVYTPNRIQGEIGNNPDLEQIDFEVSDANLEDLEAITTRNAVWIPNQYAALLLDDSLTPVATWSRIYGAILQNGHQDSCEPLIQFLQVQLLGRNATNDLPFVIGEDIVQPIMAPSLIRHRNALHRHMFVAPVPGAPPLVPPPQGISAQDFQALVIALRGGHTNPTPAVAGTAVTTVEKRWSVNLLTLLKLTHCTTVAELSPVWSAIANGPKKEERNILQAALDDHAQSPGAATTAPLTVTKDLHNTIVNLMFWSGDPDRLDEGLHPFRTVYTSTAKTSMDQTHLQTYDLLANDGNLDLQNIKMFQHIFKSDWPTSFPQLDTTLKSYQNLMVLLLKPTHPYVAAYSVFLNLWNSISVQLAELFATDPRKPAQFLRSIQLRTAVYWQSLNALSPMEARMLPPPNFAELLNSLRVQSWIAPVLPGAPTVNPYNGVTPGTPGHAPAPGPAPAPAPPAPAPPAGLTPRTSVVNPAPIAEVKTAMEGRNFQLRVLLRNGVRAPTTNNGEEVCMSYHTINRCFSDCYRKASHRPLVGAEKSTFCTFIQDNVVAPDLGRS